MDSDRQTRQARSWGPANLVLVLCGENQFAFTSAIPFLSALHFFICEHRPRWDTLTDSCLQGSPPVSTLLLQMPWPPVVN